MKTKGMMMLACATIALAGCDSMNDENRKGVFSTCMAATAAPQECTDAAYRLYPREEDETKADTVTGNGMTPRSP